MSRLEIQLIDIGEGLAEAVVSKWLVKVGDEITAMSPYVEIETDKVTTELPAPRSGKILELCHDEGDTVQVGDCLLVIEITDSLPSAPDITDVKPPISSGAPTMLKTSGPKASPVVRNLAKELGVNLDQVLGSGNGGLIIAEDVRRYADSKKSPGIIDAFAYGTFPLSAVRVTIAEHMQNAWREVPHITDLREIEVARLTEMKAELKEHPSRPTYTSFFVSAVATALRKFPRLNASLHWEDRKVSFHQDINIGIATYVDDDRLVVPVIRNADQLNIFQISDEIRRLGDLAKTKKLSHNDVTGATFNISSAGQMGGGWYGTPIVSPPQVGVMGFGPIVEKVVAENSLPIVRPVMPLMISVDHRLIDGRTMCVFGNEVERLLKECPW